MTGVRIRPETAADRSAVSELVVAAFGDPRFGDLLAALRENPGIPAGTGLVAEVERPQLGGVVVGFVAVTDAALLGGTGPTRVANLSPLAVRQDQRRQGIGSALVRAAVAEADRRGEPMVVLEGDPGFYGRLGFEPSAPLGITIDLPDWAPPQAAQLIKLGAYAAEVTGHVAYPPAFDLVR